MVSAGTGAVAFNGVVGGSNSLTSLNVTGGNITLGGNVTTTGNQTYSGAVILSGNDVLTTTSSNVAFSSTVDGGYGLTVAANNGNVVFHDAVGNGTSLASLSATGGGGITLAGNVTTSGNQTYSGAVILGASDTLTAGGSITSANTVSGYAYALTIDGIVNGTMDINVAKIQANSTSADAFTGTVGTLTDMRQDGFADVFSYSDAPPTFNGRSVAGAAVKKSPDIASAAPLQVSQTNLMLSVDADDAGSGAANALSKAENGSGTGSEAGFKLGVIADVDTKKTVSKDPEKKKGEAI